MMLTQRERKGKRSDMNLRAVKQERELKRQRASKACGKQSSCCSNWLQSANYFDIKRGKSKQRELVDLFFWSVGHSCYRRWRNRKENFKGRQPSLFTTYFRQANIKPRIRIFFWHWRYSSLLQRATVYGNTNGCIRASLLTCHTANTVAQQISRVHYCTYET